MHMMKMEVFSGMGLINTQYLIHQSSSFQELAARFVPYFKGAEKKNGRLSSLTCSITGWFGLGARAKT
ncbi:hypothetical protein BsIDN1_20980 [Bacillus safensis]|uniref:Uncharacterized protein n=1 Tax=Bacillus safensis TaxID=561879 RepID=A0A5S9M4F8_BACIA|nr:hypothetical protein BsIDN1_20980 [Bacillus safensis]